MAISFSFRKCCRMYSCKIQDEEHLFYFSDGVGGGRKRERESLAPMLEHMKEYNMESKWAWCISNVHLLALYLLY
jgi:hypothetical protein